MQFRGIVGANIKEDIVIFFLPFFWLVVIIFFCLEDHTFGWFSYPAVGHILP